MKVVNLPNRLIACNYFDYDIISETTGVYASSINGKVECTHPTIKNMVRIQLLSRGHTDDPWCFCYHYIVRIIYRLINMRLGTHPIVSWYKHKNIYYVIPY